MSDKESNNNSKRPDGNQKSGVSGNPQSNSFKITSPSGSARAGSRPKLTMEEARANYQKWLERLESRASEDPAVKKLLDQTRDLATRLQEPNILGLYRLVEIFSLNFVQEKADQALALHNNAKIQGDMAYRPRENPKATNPEHRFVGTEVATAKGQPRSPGGIFFFLVKGHVLRLRLAWEDLRIPWLPEQDPEGNENQPTAQRGEEVRTQKVKAETVEVGFQDKPTKGLDAISTTGKKNTSESDEGAQGARERTSGIQGQADSVTTTASYSAQKTTSASGANGSTKEIIIGTRQVAAGAPVVKPSRGKVIITGQTKAGSQPKTAPQGIVGVLELLFEIEPNGSPPKGLPVLEKTLVKVWVTDKQFNKIKDTLTPASRYLIEGELGAGINSQNFEPFVRVICTRLTTLELEQEAKLKKVIAE